MTIVSFKSPFAEAAPSLYRAGYSVIPLKSSTKVPIESGWSSYCLDRASSSQMKEWNTQRFINIGLCLGPASGVIALDFDENVEGLHEQIEALLPDEAIMYEKRGAKGFTRFFRYNGEQNKSWKKNGITIIELLSSGRQTVMPPSIHPNGGAYEYIWSSLSEAEPESLPSLPDQFVEKLNKLINPKKEEVVKKENNFEIEDLKAALNYVSPDTYDVWVQVGMALKNSVSAEGFAIWEKWTAPYLNKNPDSSRVGQLEYKWKGFKGSGLSISTIFYLAMENGFKFDKNKISLDGIINPTSLIEELELWRTKGLDRGIDPLIGNLGDYFHFRRGEFSVWTGYPGEGKSELIDSLNLSLISQGWRSLYRSMEKSPKSHLQSLVHKYTGRSILTRTKEDQEEAIKIISESCSIIGGSDSDTDIDHLFNLAKMYKTVEGLDIFFIDPYNYLDSKFKYGNEHTRYILKTCSKMAKSLNIHVALVAHPKVPEQRFSKGEDLPKITKYSISGGSDFPNIADFLISVGKKYDDVSEINILKVRDQDIDKEGTVLLQFNRETKRHEKYDGLEF